MSVKSKNSRKKKLDPQRPFDPEILKRAAEIAGRYTVMLRPPEDGEFWGEVVELPHTLGDGPTVEACTKSAREGAAAIIAYMLECGEIPPPPLSDGVRTEQVNVRLTAGERVRLEYIADRSGFVGISDYMRVAALAGEASAPKPRPPAHRRKRARKIPTRT
jgi:predicted RNase H-like HicB family nuclease